MTDYFKSTNTNKDYFRPARTSVYFPEVGETWEEFNERNQKRDAARKKRERLVGKIFLHAGLITLGMITGGAALGTMGVLSKGVGYRVSGALIGAIAGEVTAKYTDPLIK